MTQEEIKLQPHKIVNGIAILLTDSEIKELDESPNREELLNQLNFQKQIKINLCRSYLKRTDWQIIRLSDPTSVNPLKEGVAEKRDLARSLQDDINDCTTLEQLNEINTDF